MIRCVRIWAGNDGNSTFEEGRIALVDGERGDTLSAIVGAASISFRITEAGVGFNWHTAPTRQFVLTLSGSPRFTTISGAQFVLDPGDVLLAEDTTGSGHRWQLTGSDPWIRAYIIFAPDAAPCFVTH